MTGGQGVAGSNPVSPTVSARPKKHQVKSPFPGTGAASRLPAAWSLPAVCQQFRPGIVGRLLRAPGLESLIQNDPRIVGKRWPGMQSLADLASGCLDRWSTWSLVALLRAPCGLTEKLPKRCATPGELLLDRPYVGAD